MDKFRTFIDRFRTSKSFLSAATIAYISDQDKVISDMNREQMSKGEDANGRDFGEYGAWRTAQREERGLQTEFIDLKFEGNFYESIYAEGISKNNKPTISINTISPEDWNAIRSDARFIDALGLNSANRDKLALNIALHLQKELLKHYSV